MKTYQDLEKITNDSDLGEFCRVVVNDHKASDKYRIAEIATKYYQKHNVTIENFQKVLYNMKGQAVPDLWSANYRLKTLFFRRFVLQQVQYILSNGVTFQQERTKDRLGKKFDNIMQEIAKQAMVCGICFGFWNNDHVEVFPFVDTPSSPGFAPIYDGETGQLRAGVRYWYVNNGNANLCHYKLYTEDGITGFSEKNGDVVLTEPKIGYIANVTTSRSGSNTVYENYSTLPIIPMWANDLHTSEIEGIRESIDCYDYIKSGLANDIDDTSGFYWVLKNTGGMDEVDLKKFVERMKVVKAATVDSDEGVSAEAHTLDIPTEARETMLNRLKADLYEDFQLINVKDITGGNQTATAIRAMYQPQDDKCGDFEYCIIDFIYNLLDLLGIDDEPTFKWNRIANQAEETQMVLSAAQFLDDEHILKHLPWLTPEEVDEVLLNRDIEEVSRMMNQTEVIANE